MKIDLIFEAQLREVAGIQQARHELPEESSIATLLTAVSETSEGLASRLIGADGQLQPGILVFVNDQPVSAGSAGQHLLADGDSVLLIPPISGG